MNTETLLIVLLYGITIIIFVSAIYIQEYTFCQDIFYINEYQQNHTQQLITEIIPKACEKYR